jgi:hypothetical protein
MVKFAVINNPRRVYGQLQGKIASAHRTASGANRRARSRQICSRRANGGDGDFRLDIASIEVGWTDGVEARGKPAC